MTGFVREQARITEGTFAAGDTLRGISSFTANFEAVREQMTHVENASARSLKLLDEYDRYIEEVYAATGQQLSNPVGQAASWYMTYGAPDAGPGDRRPARQRTEAGFEETFWAEVASLKEKYPQADIPDWSPIERVRAQALDVNQRAADTAERGSGFFGAVGGFAGGLAGSLQDPANVAISLVPTGASKTVLGAAMKDSVLSGAGEALIQPEVQAWRRELGLDAGFGEATRNVAFATALGGLIGAGGKATEKSISAGISSLPDDSALKKFFRGDPEALAKLGQTLAETDPSADHALTRLAAQRGDREGIDPGQALDDVDDAIEAGANALEQPYARLPQAPEELRAKGTIPDLPDGSAVNRNFDRGGRPVSVISRSVTEIGTDAETFQYKGNANAQGVTDRLAGVKRFDAMAADRLVFYEFEDGRVVVADGHQRRGLASRLVAEGLEEDVQLDGFLFREADGWTPAEVRAIAAKRNIQQGSGYVLDTARIFRDSPEIIDDSLPVTGDHLRTARGLSRLSDDAFGMALNQVVPTSQASLVGQLVDDPATHVAVLRELREAGATDLGQAEFIIRDTMRAGFETIEQIGLFGASGEVFSQRAAQMRLVSAVTSALRKQKSVFRTLTKEADEIADAGNMLDRDGNAKRAVTASQLQSVFLQLITREGAMRTQLNALAEQVGQGKISKAKAASQLIDDWAQVMDSEGVKALLAEATPAPTPRPDAAPDGVADVASAAEMEAAGQIGLDLETASLNDMLDAGATAGELMAHPEVVSTLKAMDSIPSTADVEGYATDAWASGRQYQFGKKTVTGFDAAIDLLFENAERLAWEADGIAVEPVAFDRKASILVGVPAAGKSGIANPLARDLKSAIIDADEAKKVLPEYQDGIGSQATHRESSMMAKAMLRRALDDGMNVTLPKVGDDAASMARLIEQLRDANYSIELVEVSVDPGEAVRRMIGRFQRTGRLIPPDYLEAVAGQPGRTYENLKGKADTYAKVDNSPQRGQPRRVIEGEGGRAARVLRAELERSADLAGSGSGGRGGRGSADETGTGQGPEGDALLIGDGPSADITDEIRRADAMLQRFDGCVKR